MYMYIVSYGCQLYLNMLVHSTAILSPPRPPLSLPHVQLLVLCQPRRALERHRYQHSLPRARVLPHAPQGGWGPLAGQRDRGGSGRFVVWRVVHNYMYIHVHMYSLYTCAAPQCTAAHIFMYMYMYLLYMYVHVHVYIHVYTV